MNRVLQFTFSVLLLLPIAARLMAEDEVFSGPQAGEKLTPFKARGVLADLAGKEFDLVADADGKPITIIFLHDLTRPSAAVTRAVMDYASQQRKDGMVCGVVFLSDDATATASTIKRAAHALPKVPIGISVDGGEGPGAYGLNRKMSLTVLVAKDNRVTANFPLVQPSVQADAPKIGRQIALAMGKDITPTLAQMGVKQRYTGQKKRMRKPANNASQQDPNLRPLLAPLIQKTATNEQVDQAAAEIESYVAKNRAARNQVGQIANRIIDAGRLTNYGTPAAQQYLRKWAKEFAPKNEKRKD